MLVVAGLLPCLCWVLNHPLSIAASAVAGVTVYITDYERSFTEKIAKDFFSDPSQASLTCVASGAPTILDEKEVAAEGGREIFSERKALNPFQNKASLRAAV